jgi:cysteine sulfinate desulfinase/cysteine desulfurase-like protein
MGVDPKAGMGAVRFSLGRSTTVEEIEETINRISKALPIFGTGRY